MTLFNPDTPFIYGQTVRKAFVASTCHGEPRIGKAPAQGRVLLAVVHVTVNALTVYFLHVHRKELGNIFIGRPVNRYTQVITVDLFELLLQIFTFEPVRTEPVEVGELLGRQLVKFAVRPGGKVEPDEIVKIQGGQGKILAGTVHDVFNGHYLAIPEVGTDQV